MNMNVIREITALTQNDCFTVFSGTRSCFDFSMHYHEEFELNLIENGFGARRVVGGHVEDVEDLELVLIGPNLQHAWFTHQANCEEIKEINIRFDTDLFGENFLNRNQLHFVKNLLDRSSRGILFSKDATLQLSSRIRSLVGKNGFDSVLELMSIIHDLSISRNMRVLSDSGFQADGRQEHCSRRIEMAFEHMNRNFDKAITLAEIAKIANMSEVSFSRYFKQKTGCTFIDSLNEIRLGHASRYLIETSQNISEIAYDCGFNNISNFNRMFKRKKKCTPKEFRESFSGQKLFI
jgi:AraC-like DNA-binding protein